VFGTPSHTPSFPTDSSSNNRSIQVSFTPNLTSTSTKAVSSHLPRRTPPLLEPAPPSRRRAAALHFTALKPKLIRPATHKISLRIFRAVVRLLSSELPPLARPRSRVRAAITACQHRTPADLHCPSRPPLYRRIPRTSIALVQRHLDH
jgi:hypothetical protein